MPKYIDLSALEEEIKKRKKEAESNCGGYKSYGEHDCDSCQVSKYEEFEEIINTLEVKDEDTIKRDWYNKGYLKGRKEANIPARELGLPSELDTLKMEEEPDCIYHAKLPQITIGTKIRLKTNPNLILSIISNDCHEDEFECSNGSVLSLKQIEKYYDIIK